ncbi:MAG: hypothetical protein WAN22_26230 [Solirubrobacteraceae bacterium]
MTTPTRGFPSPPTVSQRFPLVGRLLAELPPVRVLTARVEQTPRRKPIDLAKDGRGRLREAVLAPGSPPR